MQNKFIFIKFWSLVVTVSLILLMGICFLPHDLYLRYKSLDIGTYTKAKWMYERVVFDETPIDIAFIGTSHTLNSIDSEIVQNGLGRLSENDIHVVNFAIPHFGRDMHLVLTKLLIKHKKIKLLVVEVRESEARDMHPATHYLADPIDLLTAPLFVNMRYFNNLSQLPLRQVTLFFETNFPLLFSIKSMFDINDYLGAHLNYTILTKALKNRDFIMPVDTLLKRKKQYEVDNKDKLDRTSALKTFVYFNSNRTTLSTLVSTAKDNNVPVVFLYLPRFGGALRSVDSSLYDSLGRIIIPPQSILSDKSIWFDLGHLNSKGATKISNWLPGEVFEYYR